MKLKDKIDQIKLSRIKVPVYDENMYILDDSNSFPEPLTPVHIDIGDVLDELIKDINALVYAPVGIKHRTQARIRAKYNL